MKYEEIRELKQSEKSTVQLVREVDSGQVFIRKTLKGRHKVYEALQNYQHPFLPKVYEVTVSDIDTTVIEEYIEGEIPNPAELSGKQFREMIRELCKALEFLHEKGIIHRDIKPSNILLAKDGHIRLIDFDAARMHKDEKEQDTRLLGTKGYAPPEQYGFSQTDERADIYSLGVTVEQLLGDVRKPGYRRIIQKCTRLDPNKRYQTVRQVRRALYQTQRDVLCGVIILLLAVLLWRMIPYQSVQDGEAFSENAGVLQPRPAPVNPRWNGETGIGQWGDEEVSDVSMKKEGYYKWKMCRKDTADPPGPDEDVWELEGNARGNIWNEVDGTPTFEHAFSTVFWENGFYYFAVAEVGDGVSYTDSPYVVSDAFEYTGENAPCLPAPTGLKWRLAESSAERAYYATWSNLDDYEDMDSFNVTVYDKNGDYVMNNIWTKKIIMESGFDGIRIRSQFLEQDDGVYRFTVQALTSRPNEYRSSYIPEPVPEEYFSPWYYY